MAVAIVIGSKLKLPSTRPSVGNRPLESCWSCSSIQELGGALEAGGHDKGRIDVAPVTPTTTSTNTSHPPLAGRGFGPAEPRDSTRDTTELESGRRDSNPRPSPWQGDALPLRHFRVAHHFIAPRAWEMVAPGRS